MFAFFLEGELKEAVKEYKKTLNEHPQMKDLNYNIGLVFNLCTKIKIRDTVKVVVNSHFSLSLNNLGAIAKMAMIDGLLLLNVAFSWVV